MKQLISLLLFIQVVSAAAQTKVPPIRVSYFGSFLIRPGIKLGTEIQLKSWDGEGAKTSATRTLLLSPQLGLYNYPNTYTGFLVNTAALYKRQKAGKKKYLAFGGGLGVLRESVIESVSINLGSGDTDKKNRSGQFYFMPSLQYEWGGEISQQLGWFSTYTLGIKLAPNIESAMTGFVEVGVRYHITKNTK